MAASKWFLIVCVAAIMAVDLSDGAHTHTHSHSHSPAPAPAPTVDCITLAATLVDCLSFVTNGSTETKPHGTCCSSLKSVLKTSPNCLCEAFKQSSQIGISLNVTKALTLPAACKLSTPSLANCPLFESPSAAPGLSPASATATPSTGSELSPKGAPSASPGNAASALVPFSAGSLIVCLLIVALIPF